MKEFNQKETENLIKILYRRMGVKVEVNISVTYGGDTITSVHLLPDTPHRDAEQAEWFDIIGDEAKNENI